MALGRSSSVDCKVLIKPKEPLVRGAGVQLLEGKKKWGVGSPLGPLVSQTSQVTEEAQTVSNSPFCFRSGPEHDPEYKQSGGEKAVSCFLEVLVSQCSPTR